MGTEPDPQRIARAVNRAEAQIVNQHNASFAGCKIDGPLFWVAGRSYLINTVTAELELGASTYSERMTATRIVAGGMIAGPAGMFVGGAAKKRADTSRIYLTVRTPDGRVEIRDAPTKDERAGRDFMARLEMASKQEWPLTSSVGTVLPLDPSSVRTDSQKAQTNAIGAVTVALIVLGLFVHWLWILLPIWAIAAVVYLVVTNNRDAEALKHYRRGNRPEGTA